MKLAMRQDKIEGAVNRLRYISLIAVIASSLGSILMFLIGAIKTGRAYLAYFSGGIGHQPDLSAKHAITYMIQAIDVFLIGLVLMIFAGGIYTLFVQRLESGATEINSWVKITSIAQLKRILAELVIVILFVRTLEGALAIEPGGYIWENLVLPLGILMLALALKFMDLGKHD
jgi:uncharacterized membrane protein YqhA